MLPNTSIDNFIVQVNGDREFMIGNEDSFEEVQLKSAAVDGLIKMNKKKREKQFDLVYLKALLIGFCTLKTIKDEKSTFDFLGKDGMLDLLKELFDNVYKKMDIACVHTIICSKLQSAKFATTISNNKYQF